MFRPQTPVVPHTGSDPVPSETHHGVTESQRNSKNRKDLRFFADLLGPSVPLCLRGEGPGLYLSVAAQAASSGSLPCLWLAPFIPKSASQSIPEVRSPIACGWRTALSKL